MGRVDGKGLREINATSSEHLHCLQQQNKRFLIGVACNGAACEQAAAIALFKVLGIDPVDKSTRLPFMRAQHSLHRL